MLLPFPLWILTSVYLIGRNQLYFDTWKNIFIEFYATNITYVGLILGVSALERFHRSTKHRSREEHSSSFLWKTQLVDNFQSVGTRNAAKLLCNPTFQRGRFTCLTKDLHSASQLCITHYQMWLSIENLDLVSQKWIETFQINIKDILKSFWIYITVIRVMYARFISVTIDMTLVPGKLICGRASVERALILNDELDVSTQYSDYTSRPLNNLNGNITFI